MKRIFSLVAMVALLLVSIASPISAAGHPAAHDPLLRKMGFTDEQLALLTPQAKEAIVARVGGRGKLVGFDHKVSSFPSEGPSPGQPSTQLISQDQLSLAMAVVQDQYPPAGQIRFYVVSSWKWLIKPFYTLEDKIGIAWDGPFEALQSSLGSVYTIKLTNGTYQTFTQTVPSDQTPGAGFGFTVDLLNAYGSFGVEEHSGYIEGYIYKYQANNPYPGWHTGTAVTKYFHKQGSVTGSLSFSKQGPSIAITPSTSYDESGQPGDNYDWYE